MTQVIEAIVAARDGDGLAKFSSVVDMMASGTVHKAP
jgi:hypothetical protein